MGLNLENYPLKENFRLLTNHFSKTLQKQKIYALNMIFYLLLNKLEITPLEYNDSFKTFETYINLFNLNNLKK